MAGLANYSSWAGSYVPYYPYDGNATLFRITHRDSILLYVTGCLEEAGVIFSGTALDKDVAVTLVILIHNINSFYNRLDQSDQNLRLRIFCILCKGEQPFFCHFQVTDGNHVVLSALIQFGNLPLRFSQFFSQILQILLNKLLDTAICFTQISCLRSNICFQFVSFLFNEVVFLYCL